MYGKIPDLEAVGASCTYQEPKPSGDGIHHLYAHTLGDARLSPKAAINVVVTLSHHIMVTNAQLDALTREEPQAHLTRCFATPKPFLRLGQAPSPTAS